LHHVIFSKEETLCFWEACRDEERIGEIGRELEKAERQRDEQGRLLPSGGKQVTKEQQLIEVCLSTSAANRYEDLSGYSFENQAGS
jgi:hypothetical protein